MSGAKVIIAAGSAIHPDLIAKLAEIEGLDYEVVDCIPGDYAQNPLLDMTDDDKFHEKLRREVAALEKPRRAPDGPNHCHLLNEHPRSFRKPK
jgi:hypothetical protein